MLFKKSKKAIITIILIVSIPMMIFAQDSSEVYKTRFLEMWEELHDPANGYFSPDGAPYHSIETLMVEAPDHGHETTSEAYSFYIWVEAMYGQFTGDWSYLEKAWNAMEDHIIPTHEMQPSNADYSNLKPASYAKEHPTPAGYPSTLVAGYYGVDPLSPELTETYGTPDIYQMHWLLDCDNFYGYGNFGDGVSTPSYINTFQRGMEESTWETVPHPSWEEFKWGGPNGFLDIFIEDREYSKQWRYSTASDADARVVQAMLWAYKNAIKQGLDPKEAFKNKDGIPLIDQASKMGDYLRLTMFDKFYKPIGCQDETAAGTGKDSQHYLLSWYFGWGGSHPSAEYGWAWRQSSSHSHFGYQNPVAAWTLSKQADFIPASPTAQSDWTESYKRQVELYRYLQSDEGAIAGGVTNSWNGQYDTYPAGHSTFYDMAYTVNPVYADPGSNEWFGMQAWSMERMCELYYLTNDPMVKEVVDKWVAWAVSVVRENEDGEFEIPGNIDWEGQPDTWDPQNPGANADLHVSVRNYGQDLGIAACLAKAFVYYGAGTARWANPSNPKIEDMTPAGKAAVEKAKFMLDSMWTFRDDKGIGLVETRGDFQRFFEPEKEKDRIHIPSGWSGTMPNGDVIEPGVNFIDIRSNYKQDPDYQRLVDTLAAGEDFTMTFHRFWAQADIALALGEYHHFIEAGNIDPEEKFAPVVAVTAPGTGSNYDLGTLISISADAEDMQPGGGISVVEFFVNDTKISEDPTAPYTASWTADLSGNLTITAKATNADGLSTVSKPVSIVVYQEAVTGPVKMQYACREKIDTNSPNIVASLRIFNGSTESIPVNELEIRYYFTDENPALGEIISKNYVQLSGSVAEVVNHTDTENYFKVTFPTSSALIAAGKDSGDIQYRISKENNGRWNQSNDYSYDSEVTDFTEWKRVTLYRNGEIIWGSPGIIENNAPSVTLTAPAAPATIRIGDVVSLAANAADTDGEISRVAFYAGTVKVAEVLDAPYTASWTPTAPGSYSISARAYDDMGAVTSSSSVVITVEDEPNIFPTVSVTSPAQGATVNEGEVVVITADADDEDGYVSTVAFYVNGLKVGESTAAPYSASFTAGKGEIIITARATDNKGAVTTSSAVKITGIEIPNILPTISIISPASGAEFTEGDLITVTTISDDEDGTVELVEIFVDGVKVDGTGWKATAGDHILTAVATDNRGGQGTSAAVEISVIDLPNIFPTASIISPKPGEIIYEGDIVTIRVDADDEDGTVELVEVFVDEIKIGNGTTVTWVATVGEHGIKAAATDNEGAAATSSTLNVTVQKRPNIFPTVSVTSPVNGGTVNEGVVTITTASDDEDGYVALVEVFVDGVKVGEGDSVSWNATVGPHTITAVATDNEGAKTTSTDVDVTVSGGGSDFDVKWEGNSWNTGFSGNIVITNNTDRTINGWQIALDFANGEQMTGYWCATAVQSGNHVTFENLDWNASIPPGASVYVGFQGNHNGTFVFPIDSVVVTEK